MQQISFKTFHGDQAVHLNHSVLVDCICMDSVCILIQKNRISCNSPDVIRTEDVQGKAVIPKTSHTRNAYKQICAKEGYHCQRARKKTDYILWVYPR